MVVPEQWLAAVRVSPFVLMTGIGERAEAAYTSAEALPMSAPLRSDGGVGLSVAAFAGRGVPHPKYFVPFRFSNRDDATEAG